MMFYLSGSDYCISSSFVCVQTIEMEKKFSYLKLLRIKMVEITNNNAFSPLIFYCVAELSIMFCLKDCCNLLLFCLFINY